MTSPAPQQVPVASQPTPGTVTPLPEVTITEGSFEGKQVDATRLTLSGTAKLTPEATTDSHRVLTVDDIVTVQVDVKVTGLSFEANKDGLLVRVQRARPIEGTATIVDVVRARDTRIR